MDNPVQSLAVRLPPQAVQLPPGVALCCGAAVRATYYCGGRGHHHRPITGACRLVRTAVVR
jgi:hypothetical protein